MRLHSVFGRLLVDCWWYLLFWIGVLWLLVLICFNSVVHVVIFAHLALDICYLWTWLGNV